MSDQEIDQNKEVDFAILKGWTDETPKQIKMRFEESVIDLDHFMRSRIMDAYWSNLIDFNIGGKHETNG